MSTNPKSAHIGPMSKNSVNVPHFIAPRTEFDTPTRVTNASSRDPLSLSAIWTAPHRLGSLDFLRHGSRTSFSDAALRKQSADCTVNPAAEPVCSPVLMASERNV